MSKIFYKDKEKRNCDCRLDGNGVDESVRVRNNNIFVHRLDSYNDCPFYLCAVL